MNITEFICITHNVKSNVVIKMKSCRNAQLLQTSQIESARESYIFKIIKLTILKLRLKRRERIFVLFFIISSGFVVQPQYKFSGISLSLLEVWFPLCHPSVRGGDIR